MKQCSDVDSLQRDNARLMKEKAQFQTEAQQAQAEVCILAEQIMTSELELEAEKAKLINLEKAFVMLKQQAATRQMGHITRRFELYRAKLGLHEWHSRIRR